MVEIGVCWEGTRVRGCFATPRLHGVFREIIKWAKSFHIPGISTHIALDNSTSPLDQPQQRTFATLILIHDFQPFGVAEEFTAGYMQATCRRTHIAPSLVLIPMYKKEETPAHFGAGVL
jgi:hypothetical protein